MSNIRRSLWFVSTWFAVSLLVSSARADNPGAGNCNAAPYTTSWPDVDPVWNVCWVDPRDSSAMDGSGLELTSVRYKGKLVLGNAHIPVLNVKYLPGGCGGATLSYRDWLNQLVPFEVNNIDPLGTGNTNYAEPNVPPVTVCDHPGHDSGSFAGVAVEKKSDRLVLTSQMSAGWYRYIQVWTFLADGTIKPELKFTAVDNSCTIKAHVHHAYWRFDFDIEGGGSDVIEEQNSGSFGTLVTEAERLKDFGIGRKWRVRDGVTNSGYEIIPGVGDGVADAFGVADVFALAYSSSEKDDGGATGGADGDAAHLGMYVNGQNVQGQDVVFWYHATFLHDSDQGVCEAVGPTLKPFAAPTIQCPAPVVRECSAAGGTSVNTSVHVEDADGDPLMVTWEVDGTSVRTDNVSGGTGPTSADVILSRLFTVGTHNLKVSVTDGNTPPTTCTFTVTIQDTTPPVISDLTATPSVLWPPNHKMVGVTIDYAAADVCDGAATPQCRLLVRSNEPVDGRGDGHAAPDSLILNNHALQLRAERSGTGSGRSYQIEVMCTDENNNATTRSVTVRVPHSAPTDTNASIHRPQRSMRMSQTTRFPRHLGVRRKPASSGFLPRRILPLRSFSSPQELHSSCSTFGWKFSALDFRTSAARCWRQFNRLTGVR